MCVYIYIYIERERDTTYKQCLYNFTSGVPASRSAEPKSGPSLSSVTYYHYVYHYHDYDYQYITVGITFVDDYCYYYNQDYYCCHYYYHHPKLLISLTIID